MSRLKISGYANNELRLQLSTTPQSRKNYGDKADIKKLERRAKLLKQLEIVRQWKSQLILGKEPEIWLPQSGTGISATRIYKDIVEVDNRIYEKAFNKFGVTPSQFETRIALAIKDWEKENFDYPIPIDLNPVVKQVFKKWDKKVYLDTEWLADEPGSSNLFYRAKPCREKVELPESKTVELPGTGLKVTWVKHTVSMAECDRVTAAITAALDITNRLQEAIKIGGDNPQRSFTKRARHTLLEAGSIVDNLAGLNAVCVTLTLPGSTSEVIRSLAAYSSWLVNRLMQVVRDWRKKFKNEIEYFYVWELQKRGALHIHLCLAAAPEQESILGLEKLGLNIKDKWFELLLKMNETTEVKRFGKKEGNLPGIDMFARASCYGSNEGMAIKTWRDRPDVWEWDVQRIRKSVAAYFSKYVGKSNFAPSDKKGFESQVRAGNKYFSPGRWWGVSKSLMTAIKANRFEYSFELAGLESSELLELIRQTLEQSPISKAYGYSWQVLEKKYDTNSRSLDEMCHNKKQSISDVLLFNQDSKERCNPSRILIEGVTEIYYFEPSQWNEHWNYWKNEKDLICFYANKVKKEVVSSLRV